MINQIFHSTIKAKRAVWFFMCVDKDKKENLVISEHMRLYNLHVGKLPDGRMGSIWSSADWNSSTETGTSEKEGCCKGALQQPPSFSGGL